MGLNSVTAEAIRSVHPKSPVLFLGFPENLKALIDIWPDMDMEFACCDIKAHEGYEYVADLNYPDALKDVIADIGQVDLVVDHGTMEHCFNPGLALLNAASAVKLGGHIISGVPLNMFNHGFYNINPTVFVDFYEANGFEIKRLEIYDNNSCAPIIIPRGLDIKRGQGWLFESLVFILCVAQRVVERPLVYPLQKVYS